MIRNCFTFINKIPFWAYFTLCHCRSYEMSTRSSFQSLRQCFIKPNFKFFVFCGILQNLLSYSLSTLSSYIYCISSNPLQCPTALKHFFLLQMGGTLWLESSCTCVHAQMVAITESFCPTYQCFCTLWLGHKCQDVSGRVSKGVQSLEQKFAVSVLL